ncbi:DUF4397 domain-containing protein [Chitinophaga nivalis]|uniref:DUF4397 domain-containing protein n=1 Tax=Chitinophaga nivalis TaxID=2991709 RepID=A0ABT3IPY4_9BACT|nr:DUF4397 domain-containing protein [Chitinophaga nivalis]MCW3464289.1 DUF4397 domain-containing protein [Chitinophaga nivalis]MCW3486020.1 DUF4397 domain-containing protein [Chitinophaga nivalis]
MHTKNSRIWVLAALFGGVIGLSACLKNKEYEPQRQPYFAVVINGATAPATVDVFNNGVKLNSDGPYKSGSSSFYFERQAGMHNFSFRDSKGVGLDSTLRQYDSLQYYTILTYNTGTTFKTTSTRENFSELSNSQVNYRFINLSNLSDSEPVDLYFNNKKVDSNRTFSPYAPWVTIPTPTSYVEYKVKLKGTDSVLAVGYARGSDSNKQIQLYRGNVYTFYLSGDKNATTAPTKLKVSYIPHTIEQ